MPQPSIVNTKTMNVLNTAAAMNTNSVVKKENNANLKTQYAVDGMKKNAMENVFQSTITAVMKVPPGAITPTHALNTVVMNMKVSSGAHTLMNALNTVAQLTKSTAPRMENVSTLKMNAVMNTTLTATGATLAKNTVADTTITIMKFGAIFHKPALMNVNVATMDTTHVNVKVELTMLIPPVIT